MSRKASPAVIGGFVLAALAIAFSAMVILGSGQFLKKFTRYVIYFEGSLSGLDVGAPVEYRGVGIGQVTDIALDYTPDGQVLIPVYVDISNDRFRRHPDQNERQVISRHIREGLRAQLQLQSLVTGKMKVMLVDKPNTTPRWVQGDPSHPEIPAIPTLVDNLTQSIEELPIARIISNLDASTKQIADFTASDELAVTIRHMSGALKEIDSLSRRLNEEMPGLLATFRQNGESLQLVQKDLGALIQEVSVLLDDKSPERQQLIMTLRSLEEASHSLRNLTTYLQEHPEAMLSGKKED